MELLWSKDLIGENPWPPEYRGMFFQKGSQTLFYFMDCCRLIRMTCTEHGKPEVLCVSKALPLSSDWEVISQEEASYLMCGEKICLHMQENRILPTVPDGFVEQYRKQQGNPYHLVDDSLQFVEQHRKQQGNPYHLVDDSFQFGEYRISHKGQWGYSCHKNEVHLWDFSGRAYLYTDIFRYENHLYFGTAGQGGYFYILNLEDGKPILALKTGGTVTFVRRDSHVFLTVGGKQSQLVEVDLRSGQICNAVDLPEKVSHDSPLTVYGDKAYTVSFKFYRNGVLKKAILNCIGL